MESSRQQKGFNIAQQNTTKHISPTSTGHTFTFTLQYIPSKCCGARGSGRTQHWQHQHYGHETCKQYPHLRRHVTVLIYDRRRSKRRARGIGRRRRRRSGRCRRLDPSPRLPATRRSSSSSSSRDPSPCPSGVERRKSRPGEARAARTPGASGGAREATERRSEGRRVRYEGRCCGERPHGHGPATRVNFVPGMLVLVGVNDMHIVVASS